MRNWPEDQITLVMIRHGATGSNREHRYLGRTNESLSEEGKKELLKCKRLGCYPTIDALFTSPMKRCVQTAEILYPNLTPVCICEWQEMDFGVFEGKNYQELKDDVRYQEWIDSNGTLPFPEGESREDFTLRCEKGFQRMMRKIGQMRAGKEVKTPGMIVHGGTIMALLEKYGGGDYFSYQAANGKGYICTCTGRAAEMGSKLMITVQKKI